MKTFLSLCFVGLAVFAACRSEQPEVVTKIPTTDTLRPPITVQDTFAIGDGVEIYHALLDWKKGTGNARTFETGTLIENIPPVFRYNDIRRYYKFARSGGGYQLAFEMNKKIFNGFSQDGSVLSKAFINPQSASDTGFVVTIDKIPVYFAYFRSRTFAGVTEKNLAFQRVNERNRENEPLENILPVIWDSIYSPAQTGPRSEPDPRFDKRLLERLKKDGKLGF